MATKVFVVVTTTNVDGEQDLIADIILITMDENKAKETEDKLAANLETPDPDFDQNSMVPYDGTSYFTRDLENMDIWKKPTP